MADGSGFDPCECIYGHESTMQRLLSLLRQSQSYCTDNVCSNELPGPQSNSLTGNDGGLSMWMIMVAWVLIVTAMYMFGYGPRRNGGDKPRDNLPGADRDPPAVS